MRHMGKQQPRLVGDTPSTDEPETVSGISSSQGRPSDGRTFNLLNEVRRMGILVVDDMPTNLMLLRAMLENGGFHNVLCFQSGKDILGYLTENDVNRADIGAVLVDIVMPDMDGYALCRQLHSLPEWADVPVIMITAHERWQEQTVHLAYESGATDILFRPVRPTELLPRIISALSLKRERDLRRHREQELEAELAERKIMEARLQYLVGHDDLTGLYNRRRLEQALEQAVLAASEKGQSSALLYLDLDQFKVINDSEGHIAGDRLLVTVANILRQRIRTSDILARISSDEFGLLLEDTDVASARQTAEEVRRSLENHRFEIHGKTYHIGISISMTMIGPDETVTSSEALARADQACFIAKSRGRNVVHLYSHDDTEMLALQSDAHWVPHIRDALAQDRFTLVFQPVVSIADGSVRHFEALLRMVGNDGGLIQPGEFIVVAERMGLIHDIDRWVVRRALEVMAGLGQDYADVSFNINLSGYAFQDPSLVPQIQDMLSATGLAADRLTFEITETAAIANLNKMRAMVNQLRALGCRFALDDFGTGFSSYNYLKQFPVDYLKIDGSFILGLADDPVDQTLVKSMVEVARTLGKKTIAEFVSDQRTMEILRDYGVDYAQGYYIGMPLVEIKRP